MKAIAGRLADFHIMHINVLYSKLWPDRKNSLPPPARFCLARKFSADLDPFTFMIAEAMFAHDRPVPKAASTPGAAPANLRRTAAPPAVLILIAHGSKDPRWRAPFETFLRDLESDLGPGRVRLAYMEFASPTLFDVVDLCVAEGHRNLNLLPLFMAAGAHLATDVPEQVAQLSVRYPQLRISVLPPIGEDPRILWLMRQVAKETALAAELAADA